MTGSSTSELRAIVRPLSTGRGRAWTLLQGERESACHLNYLRVYVAHLREKIESDPSRPAIIVTEPGVGSGLYVGD